MCKTYTQCLLSLPHCLSYHMFLLTSFSSAAPFRSAPKQPKKVMVNIRDPITINKRAGSAVNVSTASGEGVGADHTMKTST